TTSWVSAVVELVTPAARRQHFLLRTVGVAVDIPYLPDSRGLTRGELPHAPIMRVVHEVVNRVVLCGPRAGALARRTPGGRVRLGRSVVHHVARGLASVLE